MNPPGKGAGRAPARVRLCQPRAGDAARVIALHRASGDHYAGWFSAPLDEQAYAAWLERTRSAAAELRLIERGADGELLGTLALSQIFHGALCSAYLGYAIGAAHAGQGYMREALGLALDLAFDQLGLHRVEANVQPDNHPSLGLLERLGFRREGFSPRYLFVNGAWRDHYRYAMLADEW